MARQHGGSSCRLGLVVSVGQLIKWQHVIFNLLNELDALQPSQLHQQAVVLVLQIVRVASFIAQNATVAGHRVSIRVVDFRCDVSTFIDPSTINRC